ncbi:integrase [Natronococcus pandeyae]|uniref:Integrase n=1 Tax=Natronococcus pandeyae TaxID=2055836 RepID=A0A8J8Q4G1_9EURY|nr:site-specific integrase [Natronococcus pandeyae]TYL36990.1 integrase [Natronococcus pandeyae]
MDSSERRVPDRSRGGENTVKTALHRYKKTLSGRSKTTIDHVLSEWIAQFDLESFDQIDRDCCRRYGEYLDDQARADDRNLSAATAHTYYAYVRAFLSFCVRDGYLETNPADTNDVDEFLPRITTRPDRQFWTAKERERALRFCGKRIDRNLTTPPLPPELQLDRYRDRAIVSVLGLTGVRGAEVFSVPRDDRRDGITWSDVDIDGNVLIVLGKVRREDKDPYQEAQLPPRAASALERYKRVLEPPTDEWPVFPTNHYPSKRRALEAEFSETRVETMLRRSSIDELLREHEVPPPALSTNGARSVLKRLSAKLDTAYDDLEYDPENGEYLKPHGARRGLGHELYKKGHAEVAQKSLRHTSMDVTDESYQDIQAGETAKAVDDILGHGEDE